MDASSNCIIGIKCYYVLDYQYNLRYFHTIQALETKLASCRNFVKDQPREKKSGGGNSPRLVEIKL